MNDRELLELAAKATKIHLPADFQAEHHQWNPLADDGDALRLAVKLKLRTRFTLDGCNDQYDTVVAERGHLFAEEQIGLFESGWVDEYEATRRAIVRAAAEIGRNMK